MPGFERFSVCLSPSETPARVHTMPQRAPPIPDASGPRKQAARAGGTVLPNIRKGAAAAASSGGAPSFAPACSIFRRYLRGKGLKFTPERAMVLDAVLAEEGLFDADRVAENLKSQGHRGSRATT